MSYSVSFTTKFKRDYKTIKKRGYPLDEIHIIFNYLTNGEELSKKHRAHKLSGEFSSCWECHIRPDWLLIWEVDEKLKKIKFIRTGTHSDLFN